MTIKEFINPARIFIKTKEGKGTTLPKYLKKISEDVYSSEEVKTNKVWVDENGKKWPVYRKKINLTGIIGNIVNGATIPCEIPNIKEVTHQEYNYMYGTRVLNFPLVEVSGNTLSVSYDTDTQTLYFVGAGSWGGHRPFTATFEYTKTTD